MANPLTHYCPKCKETVPLRPSSELELNRDERDHVFECGDCGQIIDVDDPRQDAPTVPLPKREVYVLQSFDEKEARWMWEDEFGPLSMMVEILKANIHASPTTGFRLQLL